MPSWTKILTWAQWMIAASIYATSDEDRMEITYEQFADMMTAVGFRAHAADAGTLRPPPRFRHLPNGEKPLCYNPSNLSAQREMSYGEQDKLQMEMRELYGIELENLTFQREDKWEAPGDPNDPIPIPDMGLWEDI